MTPEKQKSGGAVIRRPVTVVGAGFSGLVTALYLVRAGFRVEIVEKTEHVGGMISTQNTPFGLVETAANAILNSKRVEELFSFLGVQLLRPRPQSRKRYIFRAGWPRRWPLGFLASVRVVGFCIRDHFARKNLSPHNGETVRAWAERVIDAEASRYLLEPALQGIYAGDPARMSASLIFGKYFRKAAVSESRRRVSIRGSVSAKEGMGQLISRMRERLVQAGVSFRLSQTFPAPLFQPKHPLVIATSAPDAALLLCELDPLRARALASIEMLPLYSVTVSFRVPPPACRGFGCLFPPVEGRQALGVLMNSFIFPKRTSKGYSETWIFGGANADAQYLESLTDAEFLDLTIGERQATLQGAPEFYGYRVTRWQPALPHYTTKLEELMPELKSFRCNSILVGNYLGEIGLSRILEMAARAVDEIRKSGEWEAT